MMGSILKDISLDILGFGIGAGISASLYAVFKTGQQIIKKMQDTPELCIEENLIDVIKNTGGIDACIWGNVQSDDVPLHAIQDPKVMGVIWKHTIREHIIAQIMGVWTNDRKTINETTRSIPFSLINNGIKVKITNPSKFESVDLAVISEKFVSAKNSLAEHIWGFMKGVRSTGTQYTEEMLVEGTRVLGFGTLVFENGLLQLKPHGTIPFILTTKDREGVIEDFESPQTTFKFLSFLSACGALYFSYRIAVKMHKHWKDYKKRRIESRVLDEVRQRTESKDLDIPESLMCLVCCGLRDILIMPCKHICVCGECYQKLDPKICPVCRTPIEAIEPVFYS